MRVEGMWTLPWAMGKLVAVAVVAGGLATGSPAQADTWQDALRDADHLHDAAEDLHERAMRLHDHHALPVTAALDQAAANLYHGLKHDPCAADVVPLLNQTDRMLREVAAVMALSCDLHTDRRARALLSDARHHFVDTAEHVERVLHDHHDHGHHRDHDDHGDHRDHRVAPTVRYPHPQPSWPSAPFGTHHFAPPAYSAPPAWTGQHSPPVRWGSGYRGPAQGHSGHYETHRNQRYVDERHDHSSAGAPRQRSLPRVLISELSSQ